MGEGLSTGIQCKYKMERVPWGKACCIKGGAATEHVASVAGSRNMVDVSMFRAPEQNLCIET